MDRVIAVKGEINVTQAREILDGFQSIGKTTQEPIWLEIDTPGGNAALMNWFRQLIDGCGVPVIGKVVGHASSLGFCILQFCQRRVALSSAILMMHAPGTDVASLKKIDSYFGGWAEELQANFGGEARYNDDPEHREWLTWLAERTSQSIEQLDEWCREERRFTAPEALSLGLLDEIVNA